MANQFHEPWVLQEKMAKHYSECTKWPLIAENCFSYVSPAIGGPKKEIWRITCVRDMGLGLHYWLSLYRSSQNKCSFSLSHNSSQWLSISVTILISINMNQWMFLLIYSISLLINIHCHLVLLYGVEEYQHILPIWRWTICARLLTRWRMRNAATSTSI